MSSISITYNALSRPIDILKEFINKWISKIELNQSSYKVEIINQDSKKQYNELIVTYKSKTLFNILFYKGYSQDEFGKSQVSGMFILKVLNEGQKLLDSGKDITLYINNKFQVNYNDKYNVPLGKALMDVLPLREEDKVDEIIQILGIKSEDILFDSYEKRYIITSPINEFNWKQEESPKTFYKYISLNIFNLMLDNKTFRMNSIISQSDTTETFYLGDFLCDDYEDEHTRFKNVLTEKNILISSFTTLEDDSTMWKEYGDEGSGIRLEFETMGNTKLYKVQYIDEKETPLAPYRQKAKALKEKGIRIHYAAIDDCHRFVKNNKYQNEHEWRMIVNYKGKVNYGSYGKKIVSFKDFLFNGNELPDIGLKLISIKVGSCLPQGINNFPLIVERVRGIFGTIKYFV